MLAEKPLISEETDCIEPALLDELIAHISSLASVFHKPPSAFIDGASYQAITTLNNSDMSVILQRFSLPLTHSRQ